MTQPYNRVFVTLTSDSPNSHNGKRIPQGTCVIETRGQQGVMSISVQDIGHGMTYRIFAIQPNEGDFARCLLGVVSTDQRGKGQSKIQFNGEDMGRVGVRWQEVGVIALAAENGEWVLQGFVGEVIPWKEALQDERKRRMATEPELEPEPALQPEREITPQAEQKPELEPEQKSEPEQKPYMASELGNNIHENFKAMAHQFNEEIAQLQHFILLSEQEKAARIPKEQPVQHSPNTPTDALGDLFTPATTMSPFKQKSDATWVRIGLKQLMLLPQNGRQLAREPFVVVPCKRYNHLLLGKVKNMLGGNTYRLGIPQRFFSAHKEKASQLGFNAFIFCDDRAKNEGDYGYWMMDIKNKG